MHNEHTKCRSGSCTEVMVEKTDTLTECIHICLDRARCTHYIWYKPGTMREKTCWVVEEKGSDVYRDQDMNTITGSCIGEEKSGKIKDGIWFTQLIQSS